MTHLRTILTAASLLVLSGCSSIAAIDNESLATSEQKGGYSLQDYNADLSRSDDITLILAFSGGGSRAAAFSYGVMESLRDTRIMLEGKEVRLLDEIDMITSVSGGSFLAAYYGLYGERLFDDFRTDFLEPDYMSEWLYAIASPLFWFSRQGRTDIASRIYEERLFGDATFADLGRANAPLIIMNATDLGGGIRFSFIQEYFDLLCSDIASYPIARAVTASSAVPVMLNPVVLKNHKGCSNPAQAYLKNLDVSKIERAILAPHLLDTVEALQTYENKDEREFIHLADGGITDNLGLMAFYETVEIGGGIEAFMKRIGNEPSSKLVIISVNAAAKPRYAIESSKEVPPLQAIVNAATDAQLHRYNSATISLIRQSMNRWSDELSEYWAPVEPYLIELSFDGVQQPEKRLFLNQIPTSMSLSAEQTETLIRVGNELLLSNPDYIRLIEDLE